MMRVVDRFEVARSIAGVAVFSLCIQLSSHDARAWSYPLSDGNSSLIVNTDGPNSGVNNWVVDGQNNLYQQWFWYRVGSSGGESTINALPMVSVNQTGNNSLSITYGNSQLSISAQFLLSGGSSGSGSANIKEELKITNLTGQALDFHFFQYTDFDLGGSYSDDSVQLFTDLQGLFTRALQSKANMLFADTLISPGADRGQAGVSSEDLAHALDDGNPTTLNNNQGPVYGDGTWAFQWDRTLGAGDSLTIDIVKSIYVIPVPEPSSAALLGVGLAIFGFAKRRFGRNS